MLMIIHIHLLQMVEMTRTFLFCTLVVYFQVCESTFSLCKTVHLNKSQLITINPQKSSESPDSNSQTVLNLLLFSINLISL